MRNFTFETRKRSFVSAFSRCMTVPKTESQLPKNVLFASMKVF